SKDGFKYRFTGDVNVVIEKLAITVTAESSTVVYNGQTHTNDEITADKALVGNHTISTTESATGTDVGEYIFDIANKVVVLDGTGADVSANYAITTVNGKLTITQKALSVNDIVADITAQIYDGDATLDAATLKIGDVVVSWTDAAFNTANVGATTATFNGLTVNSNYALDATTVTVDAVNKILAKEITISGITAADKVFDGNASATLAYSGVVFDGIVSGDSLTISTVGSFADANVGVDKVVTFGTLVLDGASIGNYVLAANGQQTETTATITAKEVTLDWTASESYTYNGADQSGTVGATFTDVFGTVQDLVISFNDTFMNAGDYTATAGEVANYAFTNGTLDLTIGKALITITTESAAKIYGESDPELTFTVAGIVDGSDIADVADVNMSRADGENVGEYLISAVAVSKSGNYDVEVADEASYLTITARKITVKADDIKIDTGKEPEFTYTYTGELVGSDAFSGTLESEGDGKKPGEFVITQGTLTLGDNYAITFIEGILTVEGGGQDAYQGPAYNNPGNFVGVYGAAINTMTNSTDHHENVPTLEHQNERSLGYLFSVSNKQMGNPSGAFGVSVPMSSDVDIHAHTLSDLLKSYDKSEQIIASPANEVKDAQDDMKDLHDFSNNPYGILPDDEDLHTRAYDESIDFSVIGEDVLAGKADAFKDEFDAALDELLTLA
ncbi:MAG: hypothetical protein J6Q65_02340, partial [Lentisphaeria bacterium]|nr:hypothetical protein [Lentisphaeria bacterium]